MVDLLEAMLSAGYSPGLCRIRVSPTLRVPEFHSPLWARMGGCENGGYHTGDRVFKQDRYNIASRLNQADDLARFSRRLIPWSSAVY